MSVLAAGVVTLVSQLDTTADLSSAVATGGTGPYTYQWYRDVVPSFTPGIGNILAGKTSLSLTDSTLSFSSTYYYAVVATDAVSATATSNYVEVITPMATTAGALSKVSVGSNSASLSSAVATGGTGPYTYQWQRSLASGSGYANITGATSLTLNDSGLLAGTPYYYKVVATDAGSVSGTSAALEIITSIAAPQPNQFVQSSIVGMLQMPYNFNTLTVQVDAAQVNAIVAGQAVKFATTAGGVISAVPLVLSADAQADHVCGFVNYNLKNAQFAAGDIMEISMRGNVMYLQACSAIARGQSVVSCPPVVSNGNIGGVTAVTGSSGFDLLGFSLDQVSAGQLVRIELACPASPVEID